MERLSGLDASFLYLETPAGHMHIAMVAIYDVSTMIGGYSFDKIRAHIESRLQSVPPFRRRLVEVPFQFHHPVWIEDPDFDLDNHVRRVTAPAPGGRRELASVTAEIASVPLDRSRPLWEAWVIEGLKHDRVALVIKVHHSSIDGASGAEIMTALYDLSPVPDERELVEIPSDHLPNELELLSYAAISKLRRARDMVPLVGRTVRSVTTLVSNIIDPTMKHGAVPLSAPRTPFNQSIGPRRTVAFARLPLDETKAIKTAMGVKVNDVVLEICSGTLRRYLLEHDSLPEDPLLAVVPVSVRVEEEVGAAGNKVSAMFASLATNVDDAGERLELIRASTEGAKEDHNAIGARTLTDWAEWSAPRTFGLAARLYSSMNLANQHRPIHNLVISNVPGPPFPLYLAGAELVAAYPMGPIMDGAGLNITVISYRDHIDIGFLADADLVPDIWEVAAQVRPAFDELKAVAGLVDPTIVKSPAPVTSTSSPPVVDLRTSATGGARTSRSPATGTRRASGTKKVATRPGPKKAAARTSSPTRSAPTTSVRKTTSRRTADPSRAGGSKNGSKSGSKNGSKKPRG